MMIRRLRSGALAALTWLAPSATVLLGFCIEHVPLNAPGAAALVPQLGIMLLLAISIRKIGAMPPWLVFVLCFLAELYAGAIPGSFAIPALAVRFLLIEQREFFAFAPFFATWAGLGVLLILYTVLHWGVVSVFHLQLFDPTSLAVRTAVSIACYPIVAALIYAIDMALSPAREAAEPSGLAAGGERFLRPGTALPQAVKGQALTRQRFWSRWFQGSIFRRIRRTNKRKPWMEL